MNTLFESEPRDDPRDEPPEVLLFTDGACSGNPGPGGWAFLLRHPASGKELERSGGERETTNNRMELLAVIRGLEALKRPTSIELISDSVYVGKGISEWMPKWKANGWRRREGKRFKEVKNEDLWRRLDELLARHRVRFTHVRGHAGHPENERCDTLAVAAYQKYL
jgi:ribonuclease HI